MAVVNCRECGKSVSTEATTCPHCGAPKPAGVEPKAAPKAAAKPLPKWLAWAAGLAFVAAIVSTCSGDQAPDQAPAASSPTTPKQAAWYEGGTLHKATVEEWHAATPENKLATAADWWAVGRDVSAQSAAELRANSQALAGCIDKSTADIDGLKKQRASDFGALCVTLMK